MLTDVTPSPTLSTMATASWPKIQGNLPSLSCPSKVYISVWQRAFESTFTLTSPFLGTST